MTPLETCDILIKNALLYDGSGAPPIPGDLAILGQRIAAVGEIQNTQARTVIDAAGQAVAPGFINMLSWAAEALLADGRSQSDIRQGVTLEVMGEGFSYGPLNQAMKQEILAAQSDFKFDIPWTTLDEHLEYLTRRGVSTNVTSFVGAGTLRTHVMGDGDRPASPAELAELCSLAARRCMLGRWEWLPPWRMCPNAFTALMSWSPWLKWPPNMMACLSPICAAKATACWRASTK